MNADKKNHVFGWPGSGQKRDHKHRRAFAGTEFERIAVRFAERMVRKIVRSDDLYHGRCPLTVDATGGCAVRAVTITGGKRASGDSVPKQDLMAELLALLGNGKLAIGNLREGEGKHDDLAMALALACWSAKERDYVREGTRRLL